MRNLKSIGLEWGGLSKCPIIRPSFVFLAHSSSQQIVIIIIIRIIINQSKNNRVLPLQVLNPNKVWM